MWIEKLNVQNCRLLKDISLELSPDLNIIIGENASGKTSLLEALNLLASGKSFRTSHISEVISHNKESVLVSAKINIEESTSQIGIEKNQKKTKIRINHKDVFSQAELSLFLPISSIHPESISLITGSPSLRRSYIDWIAFYLYPSFHGKWRKYRHILKQRNLCLKNKKHFYALNQWTEELAKLQPEIHSYRKDALLKISPVLSDISNKLLGTDKVELTLKAGFPSELNIEKDGYEKIITFYKSKEDYDLKVQRTVYGIHSADIKITLGDKPAKESASRGQLKLLAISMLLAQSRIINKENNNSVLLIDDLAAELDSENKQKLLNYLSSLKQQLVITSTHKIELKNIKSKMFHVKHGVFNEEETL